MPYPMQSPIDPTDIPEPVGEVPPTLVAVPAQARQLLSKAGQIDAVDGGLVRARLEELETNLLEIQRAVNEACANLQMALRGALGVRFDAGAEREGCEE